MTPHPTTEKRPMTDRTRWMTGSALCAALWLCTPSAVAQSAAPAAEALFQQGREEMAAGRYDSACAKLRQSDELDPAPGTKLNLAECEAARGRIATAWELLKAAEQKLDPTDPRYPIARQKREALEPRLPKLQLSLAPGAPEDTTVRIAQVELRASAFGVPLPLDPGRQELIVTASGRSEARVTVVLEEGKTAELQVMPGAKTPDATGQSAAAPSTSPPPASEASSSDHRTLGYVLGGVGLAGLAGATVAGILTLNAKSTNKEHCDSALQSCDAQGRDAAESGRLYGTLTTAGLVVGLVGVGVGTYFIVSSGPNETGVTAQASAVGGRLTLVRRW
jgi:hypothetical protein